MKKFFSKSPLSIILGIFIFCALAFSLSLIFNSPKQEQHFKQVELDKTINLVANTTDETYLDTIAHVGLKELNIRNVVVQLRYIPEGVESEFEGMVLEGYIIGGKYNQFIIFLKEGQSRSHNIFVLSHEMIHLQQILQGRLIKLDTAVVFNGFLYEDVMNIEYDYRPWEIEAFDRGALLKDQIRSVLY